MCSLCFSKAGSVKVLVKTSETFWVPAVWHLTIFAHHYTWRVVLPYSWGIAISFDPNKTGYTGHDVCMLCIYVNVPLNPRIYVQYLCVICVRYLCVTVCICMHRYSCTGGVRGADGDKARRCEFRGWRQSRDSGPQETDWREDRDSTTPPKPGV